MACVSVCVCAVWEDKNTERNRELKKKGQKMSKSIYTRGYFLLRVLRSIRLSSIPILEFHKHSFAVNDKQLANFLL